MTAPATMRALQQTSLNGPQDLHLITDAPVPSPGPGEILIRVTAPVSTFSTSRGLVACRPVARSRPTWRASRPPAKVTTLGEGVTGLEPGVHAIGVGMNGGAFAEYMTLPAMGAIPVPTGWADEQALGMVVSWPTALAALKPLGQIEAGQSVLIHAAAGGTGQAAVKMAKHYGAKVIAAAAANKHEVVRALGADHLIDSRDADIRAEVWRLTDGAGVDLVPESVGGASLEASLAAAKRVTRRVVVYGLAGGQATITNWDLVYKNQAHVIGLNIGMLVQSAAQIFGEVMREMFGLISGGVLGPGQPTVYELAHGPKALTELDTRATVGKLALVP